MEIKNAKILNTYLQFEDDSGTAGQQFALELEIKMDDGWCAFIFFNPMRLPQLLKKLELKSYEDLKGQVIKVKETEFNKPPTAITHILDSKNNWFKTENGIYFGSEFFKGYDNETTK